MKKEKGFSNDNFDFNNEIEISKWFKEVPKDPPNFEPVSEQVKIELKEESIKCLESEIASYNKKSSNHKSGFNWIKTMMSKGTFSDKIASQIIAIQNQPTCNLSVLKDLVGMVKVAKKKDCFIVIDALTELFTEYLLIPHCKLKPFEKRPLSMLNDLTQQNAYLRRKLLILWYFEDQLRDIYILFINALNNVAHDTVEVNKEKAVTAMYRLLSTNAEQEKVLLTNIVNKLGDPSQKVASKAIYYLTQLLHNHSNMKGVVLNEIEKLLFRSKISPKTRYNGLCFLSQFFLSHDDKNVAKKLIDIYFAFFKACVKKGEVESRMMSALLMGVNRAFPYAEVKINELTEHIDTMFRIVHIAPFNISLHALTLLFQVSTGSDNINNRFYSALYKKLADAQLQTTAQQAIFLNLIYKALLGDSQINRKKAFIRRMLQISLHLQPNFVCGMLYVISQIIWKNNDLYSVIFYGSHVIKIENENNKKNVESKTDVEISYSKENHENENIKESTQMPIKSNNLPAQEKLYEQESNELSNTTKEIKEHSKIVKSKYNPFERNPLFISTNCFAYVELHNLRFHYHPSVSLFAESILNGENIRYSGDPLKDFTLIRFLDRFVFKNPKQNKDNKLTGVHSTFGLRKLYRPNGFKSFPVISNNYLNGNVNAVPVDEKFLHVYLLNKYQDKVIGDGSDDDDDNNSVASNEFEEMMSKMADLKEEEDLQFDYSNDVKQSSVSDKKTKTIDNSVNFDDNDENEDNEEISDNEDDADEMDEMSSVDDCLYSDDDEDGELLEDFSDEDKEDMIFEKKSSGKKNKNVKKGLQNLFASAEEFATLLEDEGATNTAFKKASSISNKEGADVKQLKWEEKRNNWVKDYNRVFGGKRKRTETNKKQNIKRNKK